MRILIAGGGLQGLSCGCSLYKEHEVSIVTTNLMCRKSRFFKKTYVNVNANDESLYGLLKKEQFDVLIPVSDMTVPFISRNKGKIEEQFGVKCAVPDYEKVYQVEDKSRFMAFCEGNNIPHPKTGELSGDNLDEVASKIGFPALIKPDYSVGARGITRVNSVEELKEKYPSVDQKYGSCTLQEFIENDKIEMYRSRVSEHYNTILRSVSREVGLLMNHSAEIKGIINDVNRDFQERNFAGVIRSIELRAEESSDKMMLRLRSIRDFTEENSLTIGELNLFSGSDRDKVNEKVVDYLKKFMKQLQKESSRTELTLSDTFRLQFRVQENDNNTGWVERINNVGSDGTDVLVKAMVNIMLINVFKTRASRKNGDFIIHCMMDEIGKLHPSNVSGILQFANVRNIYLINSSPMGYNADLYKYNYLLTKDSKSQTHIKRLVTINA